HHGIRAVLLDVGVHALVGQPRLTVVARLAGPRGDQVIVEGRPAGAAAVGRAPFHEMHGGRDRDQVVFAYGLAHFAMRQVRAAAKRFLGFRLDVGRPAHTVDEYLLDQPAARPAGAGRLGVFLDFVDRKQALVANGLDDRALAYPVAAANLGRVGHADGAILAGVAGVAADGAFTEHELVAQRVDTLAFADEPEVPRAVSGISVQARAHQLFVFEHQFLVHAAHGVCQR